MNNVLTAAQIAQHAIDEQTLDDSINITFVILVGDDIYFGESDYTFDDISVRFNDINITGDDCPTASLREDECPQKVSIFYDACGSIQITDTADNISQIMEHLYYLYDEDVLPRDAIPRLIRTVSSLNFNVPPHSEFSEFDIVREISISLQQIMTCEQYTLYLLYRLLNGPRHMKCDVNHYKKAKFVLLEAYNTSTPVPPWVIYVLALGELPPPSV